MIGKDKGFKKLEDDTKKTMQRARLYHIGIIINIILLIAVIAFCVILAKKMATIMTIIIQHQMSL